METERARANAGPLLLATKFHLPRWHAGLVSRPRLVEPLRRGADRKLTLLSAPAGFGKTTLLAEWLAVDDGRSVSWLSLDPQDNDPTQFWTYAITALQTHEPTLGGNSLALLHSLQPPPIESILTSLINELSASSRFHVLVLDDLHTIENSKVHAGLGFLLDHLPAQLRLVVTTRADPPMNLARLRARGEMTELRAAELRFTADEERVFLNETMDLDLSDDDMRVLNDRTEGWIAGLQLAALLMQRHDDVAGFIRTFTGDHRYIVDYLLEEVLHQQSADVRAFLFQTSVLDRLCGPLCDDVTGLDGSAERLVALERGNFFLVPLDSTRTWYRYHHLFVDVLNARLREEYPAEVAPLHLRASAWYEQQGLAADAIGHALAAGAYGRAAELMELAAREMQRHRQEATVLDWLMVLPEDEIRRRPVLSTIYAGTLLWKGKSDHVDVWLRNTETWLDAMRDQAPGIPAGMLVADQDELERLPGTIAVYRAGLALAAGDVSRTIEYARSAVQLLLDDDHMFRGTANALQGLAFWTVGSLESAYDAYAAGMENLRRGGYFVDAIGGSIGLADLRIAQGRLHDALAIYQNGLHLSQEHGLQESSGMADMFVGMSAVHREWNDLNAAAHMLAQSEALGESAGSPQHPYRWRVALAQLRASLGDLDGAIALLDEAEPRGMRGRFPKVRPIPAIRARIWIAQGRLDEAAAWARDRGISADDPISYLGSFDLLTLARVLRAQGAGARPEAGLQPVMRLLERLRAAADAGGWTASLIEALVLEALGHQELGNLPAARAPLERALSLAQPGGYVRIFVDEGEPMRRLLREVAEGGQGGHARRVLRAWGVPDRPVAGTVPGARLVTPLTPREIEILRLIAAGLRNQEIADRLFISLPTVKRHIANVYGKLDVTHRTEALARASALGLL